MDLRKIHKVVDARKYATVRMFMSDINLLLTNSVHYNNWNSPYTHSAQRLVERVKLELSKFFDLNVELANMPALGVGSGAWTGTLDASSATPLMSPAVQSGYSTPAMRRNRGSGTPSMASGGASFRSPSPDRLPSAAAAFWPSDGVGAGGGGLPLPLPGAAPLPLPDALPLPMPPLPSVDMFMTLGVPGAAPLPFPDLPPLPPAPAPAPVPQAPAQALWAAPPSLPPIPAPAPPPSQYPQPMSSSSSQYPSTPAPAPSPPSFSSSSSSSASASMPTPPVSQAAPPMASPPVHMPAPSPPHPQQPAAPFQRQPSQPYQFTPRSSGVVKSVSTAAPRATAAAPPAPASAAAVAEAAAAAPPAAAPASDNPLDAIADPYATTQMMGDDEMNALLEGTGQSSGMPDAPEF